MISVKLNQETVVCFSEINIELYTNITKDILLEYDKMPPIDIIRDLSQRFGFGPVIALTLMLMEGWTINQTQLNRYNRYKNSLYEELIKLSGERLWIELDINLLDVRFTCRSNDGLIANSAMFFVDTELSNDDINREANRIWSTIQYKRTKGAISGGE